jgi:hypothetical protein
MQRNILLLAPEGDAYLSFEEYGESLYPPVHLVALGSQVLALPERRQRRVHGLRLPFQARSFSIQSIS